MPAGKTRPINMDTFSTVSCYQTMLEAWQMVVVLWWNHSRVKSLLRKEHHNMNHFWVCLRPFPLSANSWLNGRMCKCNLPSLWFSLLNLFSLFERNCKRFPLKSHKVLFFFLLVSWCFLLCFLFYNARQFSTFIICQRAPLMIFHSNIPFTTPLHSCNAKCL